MEKYQRKNCGVLAKSNKSLLFLCGAGSVIYLFLLIVKSFDGVKKESLTSVILMTKTVKNDTILLESFKVDENKMLNSKSQQIFFLETHLDGVRKLENPRQACSVEAAARMNPDMDIYFFFATNAPFVTMNRTAILDVLLTYPNVHIRYANLSEYTEGTKLERFFEDHDMRQSRFPIEHTSDVLRVLTVNKYGGLYLDLDVITLQPIRMLDTENFVCLVDDAHFSNAIIKLDRKTGRKYSNAYLEKVLKDFDPKGWVSNGPRMLSPAFRSFCKDKKLPKNFTSSCDTLTTWASKKCFPIFYDDFHMFYESEFTGEVLKAIRDEGAFFIHIWNKMLAFKSKSYKLSSTSLAAYMEIAKRYCPETIKALNGSF